MARDIRQRALQRIAVLSAASSSVPFDRSDLSRLCKAAPGHGHARSHSSGVNGHAHGTRSKPEVGRIPMVSQANGVMHT